MANMGQGQDNTSGSDNVGSSDPSRQAPPPLPPPLPPPPPPPRYHGYPTAALPPASYDGQGYPSSGPYTNAIHYGSAAHGMPYRPHEPSNPPPPYGPPPGPGGHVPRHYGAPDNQSNPFRHHYPGPDDGSNPPPAHYGPPRPTQSFGGHMPYHYATHPIYNTTNNRIDDASRTNNMGPPPAPSSDSFNQAERRDGATSPSQIELTHRDEVTNMGCTCKKTKCLKLYCQCFAVKIYCGSNCRCLVCLNTVKNDKQRKDAMRNILSRNPTAFDTKFSKTKERKAKEEPNLVLAHKLGCKCRKSACMKKYCECYAGSVKCSANCRCVGCKNTPPGGFGPGSGIDHGMAVRENGGMVAPYEMPVQAGARMHGREPWMMSAAHNLTFLKHGSPAAEKRTTTLHDAGEVASMPSLTASDTSPEEKNEKATKQAKVSIEDTENGGAVNTLLMAAYAMTEFQERHNSSSLKAESPEDTKPAATPFGTPKKQASASSRNELIRASPKRKSEEAVAENENRQTDGGDQSENAEASDSNNSGTTTKGDTYSIDETSACTPSDQRQMKRTRLGSVRKKNTGENGEIESTAALPGNTMSEAQAQETPNQKALKSDKLTPVSARCIDFRRMQVNENSNDVGS